ncbi:hypothetical protein [Streptomyces sp. MP131-18]|uniref:hypothetical protein n=1 Tax=Streptomyces sp. MP131-18 TaxID=1857892 RepID=UPI00097C99E1|nr:hypothetical protein [Streptomyces sp. MP131-18]ONK09455.1 hypothetical protein STBA_01550 [Streptomyces sp. MP131-18]
MTSLDSGIHVDGTYYGVPIASAEDGDTWIFGTHDRRRIIAALSSWTREFCGKALRDVYGLCPANCPDPLCPRFGCHVLDPWTGWAVIETRGDTWVATPAEADTPGASPVAVW